MANGSQNVRVRKNVRTLGSTQDDLFWYAKAVAELQTRPVTDPTSWRFLAAVHGYDPNSDPNAGNSDPLPASTVQERFWNQCQHQTWYFLPWHRGYLAYFEQIVAAAVVKIGGPSGWSLPYWNYSDSDPGSRLMPDAFVNPILSDGSPNPLFVDGRNSSTNDFQLTDQMVSLECLTHSPFEGLASGGDPGFGGPQTSFSHFGGTSGRLENIPHNVIHVEIGGLMADPDTAALDPIFWLHHANIDRLWEVWTHRNPAFHNPTESQWLSGVSFEMNDANGIPQKFIPDQMQITTSVLDGYQYDDISDPVRSSPALVTHALRLQSMATISQPPQLVGASRTSVPVTGQVTTAEIAFDPATVRATRRNLLALTSARPPRAYLNLENVTGRGQPGTYEVYIDVPQPGQQPSAKNGMFVGLLSPFGLEAASRPSGSHAGSGLTMVFEITDQLETMRSQQRWDESRLHVLFVKPTQANRAVAPPTGSQTNLSIGRISVYYH